MESGSNWWMTVGGFVAGLFTVGIPAIIAVLKLVHSQRMEIKDQNVKIRASDVEIDKGVTELHSKVFSELERYCDRLLKDIVEKQQVINDAAERDKQHQSYEARLVAWANKAEERNAWLVSRLEELSGKKLDLKSMSAIPELPAFDDMPAFKARTTETNTRMLAEMNPVPAPLRTTPSTVIPPPPPQKDNHQPSP